MLKPHSPAALPLSNPPNSYMVEQYPQKVRPVSPREAVANAMMGVQAEYMLNALSHVNKEVIGSRALASMINRQSSLDCHYASRRVLRYLQLRDQQGLYNIATVITGTHTRQFKDHDVFLVQGVDGVWYAGSPANNSYKNPRFATLYEAPILEDLLKSLKKKEGGRWPTKYAIEVQIEAEKKRQEPVQFL